MSNTFDVQNMDAKYWTDEYFKIWPDSCKDYGTMFGWFANSIMCGYDNGRRKEEKQVKALEAKLACAKECLEKYAAKHDPKKCEHYFGSIQGAYESHPCEHTCGIEWDRSGDDRYCYYDDDFTKCKDYKERGLNAAQQCLAAINTAEGE